MNEPLQARGSTRSARKFRCSKVARLEISSKIFGSIFARLEKCSKNFGSRSTLFEIIRLEMLVSKKRANLWKNLFGIYFWYFKWNQFEQIQNFKNNSYAHLKGLCISTLHDIRFNTYRESIFLIRNMSQQRLLMQSVSFSLLYKKMELNPYLPLTCDELCSM